MKHTHQPRNRARIILFVSLGALIVFLVVAFFAYVSDHHRADETALSLLNNNAFIRQEGNLTILEPDEENDTRAGLIFYPGGKVEEAAYLPLLNLLREQGITVALVKMPFHLAVFQINAADSVFNIVPSVSRWFIGGHSLGGAMASSYAAGNESRLSGLILLGAYPVNDSPIPTLCLYGSEDIMLDVTKLTGVANLLKIEGGNHAQFGNYGVQQGDGIATISREAQQEQAAAAMLAFLVNPA